MDFITVLFQTCYIKGYKGFIPPFTFKVHYEIEGAT